MRVLMWILQHALQYDFENVRKIIRKKFPNMNPETLNIPNVELLTTLASLRIIAKGNTTQLESSEDVDCLIKNIIQHSPNAVREKKSYEAFMNGLKMLKTLLQYKQTLIQSHQEFQQMVEAEFESSPTKKIKLSEEKELKKMSVDTSSIDVKIQKVLPNLIKHDFIKEFDDFLLSTKFSKPTFLQNFIEKKSQFIPSAEEDLQILEEFFGDAKLPLSDKVTEKKLIKVVEELAQESGSKEPIFCPLIYIQDPVTQADIGIKIKNAYAEQ